MDMSSEYSSQPVEQPKHKQRKEGIVRMDTPNRKKRKRPKGFFTTIGKNKDPGNRLRSPRTKSRTTVKPKKEERARSDARKPSFIQSGTPNMVGDGLLQRGRKANSLVRAGLLAMGKHNDVKKSAIRPDQVEMRINELPAGVGIPVKNYAEMIEAASTSPLRTNIQIKNSSKRRKEKKQSKKEKPNQAYMVSPRGRSKPERPLMTPTDKP